MQMARSSANRSLDLVSLPNHSRLEGSIDLDSIAHMVDPISMDDEDNAGYIHDIPGVRCLGIKRECPDVTHTAPSKLQAVTPISMSRDLVQVVNKLDFSTTDKSVAPLLSSKVEPGVQEGEIVTRKGEKFMDLDQVNDRETHCRLFKSLKEQVSANQLQVISQNNAFNQTIAEKDRQITKLVNDANSEAEVLIRRHAREIEDLRASFSTEKAREIEVLRASFSTEKAALKAEIKDLKDAITERDLVIMRHNREVEDLKTSFLMEKELSADRHRQKMATVKSKIFTAFFDEETQHVEAQSSVVQVKSTEL